MLHVLEPSWHNFQLVHFFVSFATFEPCGLFDVIFKEIGFSSGGKISTSPLLLGI
jgi:hypothetical protein